MTLSEWYSSSLPFGCSRSWAGHWKGYNIFSTVTDTDPRKFGDDWNRMLIAGHEFWVKRVSQENWLHVREWVR